MPWLEFRELKRHERMPKVGPAFDRLHIQLVDLCI